MAVHSSKRGGKVLDSSKEFKLLDSSSGGRGTSLSRDSDGRDCVHSAERGHVRRSTGGDSHVGDLLVGAVGAAYRRIVPVTSPLGPVDVL